MSTTYVMGMDCKIYYGDADDALADMTELTNVTDVTLTMDKAETDITTRANSGWRGTAGTLKECTVEFEMQWKPSDAGFQAIRDAWLATDTNVELAILTGAKDTANSDGPKGQFAITGFSRGEALEETVKVSVTAKLAEFDEWITDGAESS